MKNLKYLCQAVIIRAVFLVNKNRVANIVHDNILKINIWSYATGGSWPCFNPNTIFSVCEGAIPHCNSDNWLFIMVSAKASYTNAMAWSAGYFLNVYLLAAIAKRDTIIPSSYGCACNIDHSWSTDMNPISVEAVFGRIDHNVLEGHIIAVENVHVKQLAVQNVIPSIFELVSFVNCKFCSKKSTPG